VTSTTDSVKKGPCLFQTVETASHEITPSSLGRRCWVYKSRMPEAGKCTFCPLPPLASQGNTMNADKQPAKRQSRYRWPISLRKPDPCPALLRYILIPSCYHTHTSTRHSSVRVIQALLNAVKARAMLLNQKPPPKEQVYLQASIKPMTNVRFRTYVMDVPVRNARSHLRPSGGCQQSQIK
jgi:hypothetical protein